MSIDQLACKFFEIFWNILKYLVKRALLSFLLFYIFDDKIKLPNQTYIVISCRKTKSDRDETSKFVIYIPGIKVKKWMQMLYGNPVGFLFLKIPVKVKPGFLEKFW